MSNLGRIILAIFRFFFFLQYILFTVLLVERMPGGNDLKAGEGSVDKCVLGSLFLKYFRSTLNCSPSCLMATVSVKSTFLL